MVPSGAPFGPGYTAGLRSSTLLGNLGFMGFTGLIVFITFPGQQIRSLLKNKANALHLDLLAPLLVKKKLYLQSFKIGKLHL